MSAQSGGCAEGQPAAEIRRDCRSSSTRLCDGRHQSLQSRTMPPIGPPAFKRSGLGPNDGARLKKIRSKAGLSRRQLGDVAKVAPKTIARIERGDQKPLPATLYALADALDVDLPELAPGWEGDHDEWDGAATKGRQFRNVRRTAGASLNDAAAAAGVSISTLSRFERALHYSQKMEGKDAGLDREKLAELLGFRSAEALQAAISVRPMDFDEEP